MSWKSEGGGQTLMRLPFRALRGIAVCLSSGTLSLCHWLQGIQLAELGVQKVSGNLVRCQSPYRGARTLGDLPPGRGPRFP